MSLSDECDCEKSVPFTLSANQAFISLLVNYGFQDQDIPVHKIDFDDIGWYLYLKAIIY